MTTRLLHVSDFHLRRDDVPATLAALQALAGDLEPELLLVTGDVAHRGKQDELERAAELVRGLEVPFLAVPGTPTRASRRPLPHGSARSGRRSPSTARTISSSSASTPFVRGDSKVAHSSKRS
ncbi:MAG: hypothetical protein E6G20_05440 [Actinobacteria bacterium]|nr:MAG: hypothetical protein E6G20_05440 [Actinomycetota bacterium]